MAVTNQELFNIFLANPNMSDAQIVSLMETRGISPEQVSSTFNIPLSEVESRYNAALPFVNPVIEERVIDMGEGTRSEYYIKGTNIQADAPTFTETAPTTGLTESSATEFKANNITVYDPQAKGEYVYTPQGELIGFNAGERDSGFGGFLNEVYQDNKNVINAALTFGALDAAGLLSGSPAVGNGAFLGEGVASGVPAFDAAYTSAGGVFNPAFGLPVGNGAFLGEGVPTGIPASDAAFVNAGGTLNPAFTLAPDGLLGTPPIVTSTGVPPTGVPPTGVPPTGVPPTGVPPTGVPPTGVPPVVTPPTGVPPIVTPPAVIPPVADLVKAGLTAAQIAQLLSTGTQTAAGLLQQQTSKEAAQKAQAMIDAETAADKKSAAFRPIGMTTRFGASQFGFDPKTGQLTSAGYTLSPEAKAAQDRFVKLAEQGIQQAEGAQKAFEPLQAGAQSLFTLGNQYIAQSPESVAQNYLNQQMALLQPGRELELANLQNRLQQQGRGGLSVAQGGTLGATTPELQALYNARAQQEAQLAAQAQQFGQQNVLFGSGLLSQGAQTMGQYYGGQTAAYSPYTTALGQVQGLETAAQQPFQMGVGLGKEASASGYNVGRLGLMGAGQSVALATGADATRNPYATALGGISSNPLFTDALTKIAGGTPVNALDFGAYGTGDAGFQKMLEEVYG